MKINSITKSQNYLYEGLDSSSLRSIKLWESAGQKIVEYEMTADQITQLFGQVEKSATAAGGNRTMIGKGKDVADAVGTAWNDLKTKVQNSGPIKNIDAQYDQAAEKLKQATGGDQGVMKYVEKYRKFAKEHPIAQSFIYAALIAAAGISGAGAGGAAALGLLKMTDKLLQGEKFSSAAYSGAKTGAAAYAAGQVGQSMQGDTGSVDNIQWSRNGIPFSAQVDHGKVVGDIVMAGQTISPSDPNYAEAAKEFLKAAGKQGMLGAAKDVGGKAADFGGFKESKLHKHSKLTETQIKRMFYVVGTLQDRLNEGVWDKVKGVAGKAAGAVANKAQTIGTNLTTKVTADKLMSAWKKAGSPTDSEAVKKIMQQAGVGDDIIASTFKAVSKQTGGAGAFDQMAKQAAPADAPAAPDPQAQKFIQQLVASYQALTEPEKAQIKKELEDAVTASDVGSNVVKGTMENRRNKKRAV